jgi:hypothetical protein
MRPKPNIDMRTEKSGEYCIFEGKTEYFLADHRHTGPFEGMERSAFPIVHSIAKKRTMIILHP